MLTQNRRRYFATLALGLLLLLGGCKEELYSHLSEREANEMLAILIRHGISASRSAAKDGTETISVAESRLPDAIELLKQAGYPRPHFATMGEVFADDKLVSTPVEERARLIYALGQELSRTVSEIDGVVSARVHVVLPTDDPLRQSATPSSASVFIRYEKDAAIAGLVPQIKTLVANSIEGLGYDKVSVILIPVESHPADASAATAAGASGAEALTSVAGLWVHKSSATQAQAMIYGLLGLALLGLGSSAALLWRLRPRRSAQSGTRLPVAAGRRL